MNEGRREYKKGFKKKEEQKEIDKKNRDQKEEKIGLRK